VALLEMAAKEKKYTVNHPFTQGRNENSIAIQDTRAGTHCSNANSSRKQTVQCSKSFEEGHSGLSLLRNAF